MTKFIGLIRAELLQHRSGMILTPLIIAGLIGIFFMSQLIFNTGGVNFSFGDIDIDLNNDTVLSPDVMDGAGGAIASAFGFIGLPIFFVANIVAFFVLLSALYEERSERTILFFKSMPVSDTSSVLAKYITASLVGPFIAIIVMFLLAGLLSLATALVFSLRGLSDVWGYLGQLPLLRLCISFMGYYSLYALWVAPIFAYLLMVSALAPRSPFLVALVPIAVIAIAEAIFFGAGRFINELGARGMGIHLGKAIERSRGWSGDQPPGVDGFFIKFSDVVSTLVSPSLWIGLLLGAAFLSVAIWARSRKTL